MKRLALVLTISLVTFISGLASSWMVNYLWNAFTVQDPFIVPFSDSSADVDVVLAGIMQFEGAKYADVVVANRGPETAYYTGYSRESHCSYMIKQRGQVRMGSFCKCGTGLSEQSLEVGDTVIFQVSIPNNSDPFEVGLDFEMGEARLKRTVWSRLIQDPVR
jgi:hypothetical protein